MRLVSVQPTLVRSPSPKPNPFGVSIQGSPDDLQGTQNEVCEERSISFYRLLLLVVFRIIPHLPNNPRISYPMSLKIKTAKMMNNNPTIPPVNNSFPLFTRSGLP